MTSGKIYHGSKDSIGTTAVQLTATATPAVFGILITADKDNSGIVYIGGKGVTAGTVEATDGQPIEAKDVYFHEIDNANKIYLIGSAAGQKVYWSAA